MRGIDMDTRGEQKAESDSRDCLQLAVPLNPAVDFLEKLEASAWKQLIEPL